MKPLPVSFRAHDSADTFRGTVLQFVWCPGENFNDGRTMAVILEDKARRLRVEPLGNITVLPALPLAARDP